MLELHRLRHLEWKPTPVVSLAESVDGSSIAVARESGAIEIWNVAAGSVGWRCELTLPGRKDAAISSIAWCRSRTNTPSPRGRLFSAGLDGLITEWDLENLQPKKIAESRGGPVWQLAFEPACVASRHNRKLTERAASHHLARGRLEIRSNSSDSSDSDVCEETNSDKEDTETDAASTEQRLAVACDDGSVKLFLVNDYKDGISYICSFPRVQGRILSVAWHCDGTRVYAGGSDGCIRCWDTSNMHEVYRITVGTGGLGGSGDTCVWSLLVLRDATIVSGDSSGSTQFWDGHTGALLKCHTEHKADVLSLVAAPSHQTVFSAGADGQVLLYQLVKESRRFKDQGFPADVNIALGFGNKWEFIGGKRTHSHDVRALAVACPVFSAEGTTQDGSIKRRSRKRLPPNERNYWKCEKIGISMLVSGGNDAKLFAYPADAFLDFYPHDICPAPERVFIQLADKCSHSDSAMLMAQHSSWMDIWKVSVDNPLLRLENGGSLSSNNSSPKKRKQENANFDKEDGFLGNSYKPPRGRNILPVISGENDNNNRPPTCNFQKEISKIKGQPPCLLARIKSKGSEHIVCSAISGNGRYAAFSDQIKPRLYELQQKGDELDERIWGIKKLPLPAKLSPAHSLIFSDPLMHLILASRNGEVHVIDTESAELLHTFYLDGNSSSEKALPITLLRSSVDGQWLAACNASGNITILNLETYRLHWHVPLPDESPPTDIQFLHGNCSVMVVSTAGNGLHVLDVETRALTEWSSTNGGYIPPEIAEFPGGITGLSVPPSVKSTCIIAYSPRAMCYIDLRNSFIPQHARNVFQEGQILANGNHAIVKRHSGSGKSIVDGSAKLLKLSFSITTFEEPVLFVGHISESSLLAVECPWSEVLLHLPAPVYRHTFVT